MKVSRFPAVVPIMVLLVSGFSMKAHALLELLGQGTSAHGTCNLIYDTDLDITWYDYTHRGPIGVGDTWQNLLDWAEGLEVTTSAATYSAWRLPSTVDGPLEYGNDGTTTAGYNITTSEMGHLFYIGLGNEGSKDIHGEYTDCRIGGCLTNTGDFQDIQGSAYYSGTEYSVDPLYSWYFSLDRGNQSIITIDRVLYGVAVHPGRLVTEFDPVPDIKANGGDDPVILDEGDNLTVSIGLAPGGYDTVNADWFLILLYYDFSASLWVPAPITGFQVPLFYLPQRDIFSTSIFPWGAYIFFWGVDLIPNGSFDPSQLYSDLVVVAVQ